MRRALTVLIPVLLFAGTAAAQPMMCGPSLVEPGDSEQTVLEFCGEPSAARQWIETVPAGDDYEGMVTAEQIPMAEWLYQNGPDQFVYKVMFQNGIVQEIRN